MEIDLGNGYYLKRQPKNFVLIQRGIHDNPNRKEYGSKFERTVGYATKIEQLLNMMIDIDCRAGAYTSIERLVNAKLLMMVALSENIIDGLHEALITLQKVEYENRILRGEL